MQLRQPPPDAVVSFSDFLLERYGIVPPRDPSRELKAAENRMKQLERETNELMTQMKSKSQVTQVDSMPPGTVTKSDAEARDIMEKALEIQRLEAQVRRQYQQYQER